MSTSPSVHQYISPLNQENFLPVSSEPQIQIQCLCVCLYVCVRWLQMKPGQLKLQTRLFFLHLCNFSILDQTNN